VRNYDDFVEYITKNGLPDEISFDHDLGEDVAKEKVEGGMSKRKARVEKKETKSGYDCAKWLCDYCWTNGLPIPSWNVHSANPVGRDNIIQILKILQNHYMRLTLITMTLGMKQTKITIFSKMHQGGLG